MLGKKARYYYQENGPVELIRAGIKEATPTPIYSGLRRLFFPYSIVTSSELEQRSSATELRRCHPETSFDIAVLEDAPPGFDAHAGTYAPAPRYVCEVPDCRLVGPGAVAVTDDDELVVETATGEWRYLHYRLLDLLGDSAIGLRRAPFDQSPPRTFGGPVFPLVPFYDSYYYAWLMEYLPKLRALERYESVTGTKPLVLLPSDPPSFVTETLSLCGYDEQRYRHWNETDPFRADVVCSSHRLSNAQAGLKVGYDLSYDDTMWVRERLRSSVDGISTDATEGSKVFISRQETDRGRKISNYDEIEPLLREYGFEPYVLESYPVEEQIRLLADADVVMGGHGAGLVNMLFADDPLVVELFPDNDIRPSYYLLANMLGFDYRYRNFPTQRRNLVVDPEEFRRFLVSLNL